MRLVPTKRLKNGDIIARDIISYDGGLLLREDTHFREVFKQKLLERNIFEVYIEDELSKGIEPIEIISPQIRRKIGKDIQQEFEKLQENLQVDIGCLKEVSSLLIEEIQQKELICELQDLKVNDQYTYEHCIAVAILTTLVCNKLGLNLYLKEQIVMGALIHDIGKMILPKDILNKPDKLTSEEYNLIKTHTEIGYKMIKDRAEFNAVTKLAVLCHHEREDGSGYPLGKGTDLHIGAKIVGACDLYHALISDRCYRQGLPINEVFTVAQTEPINSKIRSIIEGTFAYYPVGSIVKLNTGQMAIVEKNYAKDIKRPLVRVIEETNKQSGYKINLQDELSICVTDRAELEI